MRNDDVRAVTRLVVHAAAAALTIAALVTGLLGSVLGGAALVGQRRRA